MRLSSFLLLLLFAGCTTGYPLQSVDYHRLFNDGNSKVWVVEKLVVKGADIANADDWQKDVMIFHNSGRVDMIPMKAIGHTSPKKGHYYVDSQKKTIEIKFKDAIWKMDLEYITEDSIYMKHSNNSQVNFDLKIVPIPEL